MRGAFVNVPRTARPFAANTSETPTVGSLEGEAINATVQRLKNRACAYPNRDRFRNAIYFHLCGLDLYTALGVKPMTSTNGCSDVHTFSGSAYNYG